MLLQEHINANASLQHVKFSEKHFSWSMFINRSHFGQQQKIVHTKTP